MNKTNVLIVGSGGREHALAWKVLQSRLTGNLYVAPGNGGTEGYNVPITATDIGRLKDFASEKRCLTIVGPEAPIAAGIVDEFNSGGLAIFGPTAEQAKVEASKAYAKQLMKRCGIPTAEFEVFEDPGSALDFASSKDGKVVVKADGLASGKGVFVCSNISEARFAILQLLEERIFGRSGEKILIEEKLEGREASYMFISDGKHALTFSSAVDHKRAFDGDRGPNTGGMGAFSPALVLPEDIESKIEAIAQTVVLQTGFRGFLFLGLMFDEKNNPSVLEFNARLGDPETEAILPRLNSDLLGTILDICAGKSVQALNWSNTCSCTVVMCSEGYPSHPKTGDQIAGIQRATSLENVVVFHSGTAFKDGSYFTNGGRVLSITGLGAKPDDAAKRAYGGVDLISWRGEHHRNDISHH